MTQAPQIAIGPVADPIACVLMVMKNEITLTWISGTYTTTTSGLSDSVCNTGGSVTLNICKNNGSAVSPDWPTTVEEDMTRTGLSITRSCSSTPTGTEPVPVYISTYSKCTGNVTIDANQTGCVSGGNSASNTFNKPLAAGSLNGIKLNNPQSSGRYRFSINPDGIVGNDNGTCNNIGPPLFGFAPVAGD